MQTFTPEQVRSILTAYAALTGLESTRATAAAVAPIWGVNQSSVFNYLRRGVNCKTNKLTLGQIEKMGRECGVL